MSSGSVQFSITCTTCKGKLMVRNERAIGQILPCPKCGSMVMIELPEGYEPPQQQATGTPSAGPPPAAASPPTAAEQPAAQKPVHPPAPAKSAQGNAPAAAPPGQKAIAGGRPASPRARAAEEMGGMAETVDDSTVLSRSDFPSPPPSLAGEEPAEGPLLPSQAASPAGNWQKPLMWGGGALAVVLVGVLLLGFVFSGDDPETAQGPETSQEQETEGTPPTPEDPPAEPQSEPPAEDLLPVEDENPTPNEDPTQQPHDDEADPPSPEASDDEPEPEAGDENTNSSDDTPPINIDDTPAESPSVEIGDIFGEFDAMLDPSQAVDSPQPDAGPDGPDADLTPEWPDLPLRDRPAFTPVEVATRLQDPIASISLQQSPLRDLLRLVSGMTTIPLAIDPEAMTHAGVSLDAPTTLELSDTTAGEVLSVALAQHGLALRTAVGCAIVEKAAAPEGLRSVRYELDDLTGGDPQALEMLADWLHSLAPADSWIEAGGEATFELEGDAVVIAQSEPVQYQVGLFCEKLRRARGLPPRLTPPLSPATLETRSNQAAEKLATKLRLNFPEPTPLQDILARLEREAHVALLVDWEALIAFGWPANTEATLTIDDGTLEEALYRLLAPMELAWRAIDADTFEITTEDALAARLELEFYSLPTTNLRGIDPQSVANHVAIDLGLGHFQHGGGSGILWYDEQSGSLIALLPQPTQRRLAVLLRNWQPLLGR